MAETSRRNERFARPPGPDPNGEMPIAVRLGRALFPEADKEKSRRCFAKIIDNPATDLISS